MNLLNGLGWKSFPTTSKVILGLGLSATVTSPLWAKHPSIETKASVFARESYPAYPTRKQEFFDARYELPASVGDILGASCDLGICSSGSARATPPEKAALGVEQFGVSDQQLSNGWRTWLPQIRPRFKFGTWLFVYPAVDFAGLDDWREWPITKQVGIDNVRFSERFTRTTRQLEFICLKSADEAYTFTAEWSIVGRAENRDQVWSLPDELQASRPHIFSSSIEAEQTARFAAVCRSIRLK